MNHFSEQLIHVSNVLYLLSYSVRSIFWLRAITVVAILTMMPYYYCCLAQPYAPIAWNTVFVLINLVQIVILIFENRPVFMGDEELHLYRTIFNPLRPREFTKLLSIAEWKKARRGDLLLEQGKPVEALMLISSGGGFVEVDGRQVANVSAGQFVGEMGFLTEQPASARVLADGDADYLAWPADKLRTLLAASPELHVKVQGIIGTDLVVKLRQEGFAAAHPSQLFEALREAGSE